MARFKRLFSVVLILIMLVSTWLPSYATEDLVSNEDISLFASGESGSNVGSGAGGTSTSPGSGTIQWSTVGVTVQVVTYPYKDSYNRENSYNNVVNTVKSYTTAAQGTTVYDGISTTTNTFMLDPQTGRVYKAPNFDMTSQTGKIVGCYGNSNPAFHPVENSCVTVEMDGGQTVASSKVTMPAMNEVEAFLQNIILGEDFGAWDVHDVAKDSSGKTLENKTNATSADDHSLFAQLLRYLGVSETLINNYVKGYSGQLSVSDDGDTPIPTVIWSYVTFESNSITSLGRYPSPKGFYYYDDESLADGVYFAANDYYYYYPYTCYTVGDVGIYSNGSTSYNSWWKTAYASSSANQTAFGTCSWIVSQSFSCRSILGLHNHTTYLKKPFYRDHMLGTGYVNSINSQGVDATSGKQYYFRGYWTPYGDVEPVSSYPFTLSKSIDAPDESIAQIKDNPMYSLAGATYQITVNGSVVETLTTNASGKATSSKEYDVGTVITVKETKAPSGFKLDATKHTFTIIDDSDGNVFNVSDKPLFDPPFAITKVDKDTSNPQGNTSFSGAVFKWEYYANNNWSGSALKTWYFSTDSDGYAFYEPDYLASGYTSSDLYIGASGDYQIPLGTIKITEIKNSLGYIVMPDSVYCSIVADSSTASGTNIIWTDASLEFITDMTSGNFGIYEPIDESLFGSISVDKVDATTGTPQGGATLENAKFQVINNSTNSVKIGSFAEAEPGEVCYEFVTDVNGHFESDAIFPLGSYTIKEAEAPDGYTLNSDWSQSFTVTSTERNFEFTADNGNACPDIPILGGLRIIKQDAALGDSTGSDAKLDGISFSVISENDQPVVVGDDTFQKGDTVLTLEIEWNGSRWVAESADKVLPYGTYSVKENPSATDNNMANDHYQLNKEAQTLEIKEDQAIIDLTFKNTISSGNIQIEKVNVEGTHLAGAKFLLEWSEDGETWSPITYTDGTENIKGSCTTEGISDGCLVTDESGIIVFKNLQSGLQYRVTEVEAPDGYQILGDFAFEGPLPADDPSVELTVVNSRGYHLPDTGVLDNGGYISVGSGIALTAFLTLIIISLYCVFTGEKRREI